MEHAHLSRLWWKGSSKEAWGIAPEEDFEALWDRAGTAGTDELWEAQGEGLRIERLAGKTKIILAPGACARLRDVAGPGEGAAESMEVEMGENSSLVWAMRRGERVWARKAVFTMGEKSSALIARTGPGLREHERYDARLGAGARFGAFCHTSLGAGALTHWHVAARHMEGGSQSETKARFAMRPKSFAGHWSLAQSVSGAKGCSIRQEAKALMLEDGARALFWPQLALANDEVVAGHGAASGPCGEEELFYLQSRGLDRAQSQKMAALAHLSSWRQDLANWLGAETEDFKWMEKELGGFDET